MFKNFRIKNIFIGKHIELLSWFGWNNPNTCLACYENFNFRKPGNNRYSKELIIMILPLHFWSHIGFERISFGSGSDRIYIGLGVISLLWDLN